MDAAVLQLAHAELALLCHALAEALDLIPPHQFKERVGRTVEEAEALLDELAVSLAEMDSLLQRALKGPKATPG